MNEMNDFIDNILKEIVWKRINEDFQNYIQKHFEKLPHKEKRVFFKLISGGDEYSNLVLENLWNEFSIKGCSAERMQQIMKEEIQKIKSELEN